MAKLRERRTSWSQLFWWITWSLLLSNAAADWTATCSHGCNCKWADGKKVAECISAGFTTIPENLSSEIQVLDLRGNPIDTLTGRAFSSANLMNLQRIYLRNCSLRQVHKDAFQDLNIMIEVDLSYNQLTRLVPETFGSNESPSKLRFLYLNGNPLQKLEAHQFPPLPHLRTLELMNCNLESLDKKAFMHLSALETLKLSDNRLTNLKPEVFLPLGKLKSLSLEGNPWLCDCRLLALRDYLSEANLNSTRTLCAGPASLVKQPWSRLAKEDFACKPVVHLIETAIEGRPGFDATFSCRVTGSPPPTITWILQNRQVVNASTATSQSDHFTISQGAAPPPLPASHPPGHVVPHEEADRIVWSNLTLRRIGDQDAGEYRCVAENKGGRVEANVTLLTPPSPVIVIIEEETGVPYTVVIGVAAVVALLLLLSLLLLTVCLCRRHKKRSRRASAANVKQNGNHHKNSNGTNGSIPGGRDPDQEKSLLEMELDVRESVSQKVCAIKSDGTGGYQPVSQSDVDTSGMMTMMTMGRVRGSLTYIPGEKFDERVPDPAVSRLLMANGAPATGIHQIRDLSTGSPIQLTDGSFYPDLLDIPHRARGGGSPSGSGMSALSGSTVPDTSRLVMPLNPAHLAGHPSYHTSSDYRIVPATMQPLAIHPPLQFTDSNSTSSGAVMVMPAGARPGYVTLPRRPRPRMPSWSSNTPVAASPAPSVDRALQPIYDTIGPRITADGSSSSALSLNKIAGLTPDPRVASPTQSFTGHGRPLSTTLDRVHKMSLPAYYVPIEEVDVPASPMMGAHRFSGRSSTLPKSTPNICEASASSQPQDHLTNNYGNAGRIVNNNQQPVLPQHFSSPARCNTYGDDDPSPPTTSTPNSNTSYTSPEVLSPIPDFRSAAPGSRASVSSVGSVASRASGVASGAAGANGVRRKIPPAVAPKPMAGSKTRPLSSALPTQTANGHQQDSLADALDITNGSDKDAQSLVSSPIKVPPKPPPKPKKRLSLAESVGAEASGRVPDEDGAVFEDEGEDGTEV